MKVKNKLKDDKEKRDALKRPPKQNIIRPKMDNNKALRVMGFNSAREFMDVSMGLEPKKELDKRHFAQSMFIMKKSMKPVSTFLRSYLTSKVYILFNIFFFF